MAVLVFRAVPAARDQSCQSQIDLPSSSIVLSEGILLTMLLRKREKFEQDKVLNVLIPLGVKYHFFSFDDSSLTSRPLKVLANSYIYLVKYLASGDTQI